MNFSDWMDALKDSVPLTEIAMPGSHNAGCRGMIPLANCQDDDLETQLKYGVRHFCIRIDTGFFSHKTVFSHSVIKGKPLEDDLAGVYRFTQEHPGQLIILDVMPYGDEHFGPFTFRCRVDNEDVSRILKDTLGVGKYALKDIDDINGVTMGDVRKSGRRILIINQNTDYYGSVKCEYDNPWFPERQGLAAPDFAETAVRAFDTAPDTGLFSLQTQQTGGPGTQIGLASPRKNDVEMRRYFGTVTEKVRSSPAYLKRANIFLGDYMTKDFEKAKKIISLNIDKGNIKEDCLEDFSELVK